MTEKKWEAAIEAIDGEIYVIADGLRVAKRDILERSMPGSGFRSNRATLSSAMLTYLS